MPLCGLAANEAAAIALTALRPRGHLITKNDLSSFLPGCAGVLVPLGCGGLLELWPLEPLGDGLLLGGVPSVISRTTTRGAADFGAAAPPGGLAPATVIVE